MEEQYNYKQVIAYAVIGLEHYLNSGNKNNSCGNICKHGKTGCHIIRCHTYKTSDNYHMKIRRPKDKVVNI